MDISDTIVAKSDQLNAEDLIAGPITVTITGVKRTSDEQPVSVELSGGHKPWKPCKTMRRLLIMAWPEGAKKENGETKYDPSCWVGRSVTLVRDPSVKWAGELVGGIRVTALSHIKSKFDVSLAESKKKKKLVTVDRIDTPPGKKPADKPAEQPLQDNAARFKAMKDEWKIAQKAIGGHLTEAAFREFADTTTGGMVPAAKALEPANYTAEHLAACEAAVKAMMPQQGEDF